MARIDLDDPYVAFLEAQVKAGLYNTISEAARDAIRKQMDAYEAKRIASIERELAKGELSIAEGRTKRFYDGIMDDVSNEARRRAESD